MALQELPIDTLWKDVALQLEASLKVESSNGVACAASARLWEGLLEDHRVPYLLLRVADMRFVLGSQVTALNLYELLVALKDETLENWIRQTRPSVLSDTQEQLSVYQTSENFSQGQRWRSTITADAAFRRCKIKESDFAYMYRMWKTVSKKASNADRFFNLHCIERTVIEGVVMFDEYRLSYPSYLASSDLHYRPGMTLSWMDSMRKRCLSMTAVLSLVPFAAAQMLELYSVILARRSTRSTPWLNASLSR